jgi:hypothetical protein
MRSDVVVARHGDAGAADAKAEAHRLALRVDEDSVLELRAQHGPTAPSLDRIKVDGDYSARNVRVVLYGVNGVRGNSDDAMMRRIARAVVGAR